MSDKSKQPQLDGAEILLAAWRKLTPEQAKVILEYDLAHPENAIYFALRKGASRMKAEINFGARSRR